MNLSDIDDLDTLGEFIDVHGIDYKDDDGNSILHHLAKMGKIDLIINLVRPSKDNKFNINIKNNLGRTALYYSLNEEVAELLLKFMINYRSVDLEGKKAEDVNEYVKYVIKNRCSEIKNRIMKHGLFY